MALFSNVAPSIDFTARTFQRLRERSQELLQQRVSTFRFRSFIATDVVPAILDVMAWYHEQNAHYYERRRLNSLLILADNRQDMQVLTQAQGYRMRPATSASVAVQATPLPPQSVSVTLTKGTRVTAGERTFEIAVDAVIPAGVTVWPDALTDEVIALVEGATRVQNFVSDGAEFQSFTLEQPGTIDGSVEVRVLNELWEEVASLVFVEGDKRGRDTFTGDGTDSQEYTLSLLNAIVGLENEDGVLVLIQPAGEPPSAAVAWQQVVLFTGAPNEYQMFLDVDGTTRIKFGLSASGAAPALGDVITVYYLITGAQKRYALFYDSDDRATILFGDGLFGVIPATGAAIEVRYRTGGGIGGNIAVNEIDTVVRGTLPNGNRASVRIRNLEAASGGEARETVEHARFFAPRVAKSNGRAVTQEDWTAHAATFVDPLFGAPAHAHGFLKQRIPELNTVCVAVWSRDSRGLLTGAGTPLKLAMKKFLDTKRTITTVAEMKDGTVVTLDIEIDVELTLGTVRQVVFSDINLVIERFFNSNFIRPGVDVSISRLYRAIQNVPGVERAEIRNITGAQLASLALGDGDGNTKTFSGNFVLEEGTTLITQSLVVTDGTQQVIDDGEGGFTGDVDTGGTNTVDYATGEFTITFLNAPGTGTSITAEAKLGHFFPTIESLGASDGSVDSVVHGSEYFPIIKRAPRGVWSGDKVQVIDSFQVGPTARMRGRLLGGMDAVDTPTTISIADAGGQVGSDNGAGAITGAGIFGTGSVDYATGEIDFTFLVPPTLPVVVTWTTRRMDIFVPQDLLPLQPGRVFIWGGFSVDGVQPPGSAELLMVDDGTGNMTGDAIVGGAIEYETGRIQATWNAPPPPGAGGGATLVGTLVPAPDGVTRTFDWSVPGDLSRTALGGEGRTRFQFSDLSTPGVTYQDAYDNWQGRIHGESLDSEGLNTVVYSLGNGKVTFETAPPVAAGATFGVQVTNVATLMYAGWVYRVKAAGGPGLAQGLFSDNFGRLWGPPGLGASNPFPTDRLEHARGQVVAALTGVVGAGLEQQLTYDALTGVPPALDIPIQGDEVASLGKVTLTEKPPEINI